MTARTTIGRAAELFGWLAPTATLVLLPKCPMCIAGYVAVATGLGISFSTAGWIRLAMMVGSVGLLFFFAIRQLVRWRRGTGATASVLRCRGACSTLQANHG